MRSAYLYTQLPIISYDDIADCNLIWLQSRLCGRCMDGGDNRWNTDACVRTQKLANISWHKNSCAGNTSQWTTKEKWKVYGYTCQLVQWFPFCHLSPLLKSLQNMFFQVSINVLQAYLGQFGCSQISNPKVLWFLSVESSSYSNPWN